MWDKEVSRTSSVGARAMPSVTACSCFVLLDLRFRATVESRSNDQEAGHPVWATGL